jgi:hypothetical protein
MVGRNQKMTMPDSVRKKIGKTFCLQFPDQLDNPRIYKADALFDLASRTSGTVLEIGTFQGCGAISLALGLDEGTVYTVDDFLSRRGWAGEPYNIEDKIVFWRNVRFFEINSVALHIMLYEMSVDAAYAIWQEPVSLLYWDLWGADQLALDFPRWSEWVKPGGVFAVHDLSDRRWKSDEIFAAAIATGKWETWLTYPKGYIWSIRRVE